MLALPGCVASEWSLESSFKVALWTGFETLGDRFRVIGRQDVLMGFSSIYWAPLTMEWYKETSFGLLG